MKKWIALFVLLCLLPGTVHAYSAASWAVYDPLTGRFVAEQGGETPRGMASTTKLMTALVAAERYEPERLVEVKYEWCCVEGSSMYLKPGERLTVRELLYGLLLCSGNDAATALASMDGDFPDFVARMNERAAELGMKNTHFDNPSGLDGERHYSTAKDLCLLAQAVLAVPLLREIVGTRSMHLGERWMTNHNKLLAQEGVLGLKTGYTRACGRCLVSAMERDGRTLIAATLCAPDDWNDHLAMYAAGFAGLKQTELVSPGPCGSISVAGVGVCRLYTEQSFSLALREQERAQVRIRLKGPRMCYPGIAAGEQWGTLCVELYGATLFETEVYYAESFSQPEPSFWERLLEKLQRF